MKNYMILHGFGTDKDEYWDKSLVEELQTVTDIEYIAVPDLPTKWATTYSSWAKAMELYYNSGFINESTTVVAHSLGAVFFVKWLAEKNIRIDSFISVSAPSHFVDKKNISSTKRRMLSLVGLSFAFDGSTFERFNNLVNYRYCFYGDNDNLFSTSNLSLFADHLYAQRTLLKGADHMGKTSAIKQIPELNNLLLSRHNMICSDGKDHEMN